MRPPRPFVATYRLQLSPEFGFDAAAGVAGHVAALGASHLYLSPIFEARPGSTHGYDQTDPTRLRIELGGPEGFERLVRSARRAGLGILLDIVPNHVAAHHENPWWWAMLRDGPDSYAARFFDVDWSGNANRVVLPVLGAALEEVIAKGELEIAPHPPLPAGEELSTEPLAPCLRYHDRFFPLAEGTDPSAPLPDLCRRQHYELCFWKEGLERINYRRFFDISDLAGVCVDDPVVFDALHAGLLNLVAHGWIDAVRVDHVDGLLNPAEYLARLDEVLARAAGHSIPIVVEKILAPGETLPPDWAASGTSGYDFLAAASGLSVDAAGLAAIRSHAVSQGAAPADYQSLRVACKALAARTVLAPELDRLRALTCRVLSLAGSAPDANHAREALVALSARLDAYRTYVSPAGIAPVDRTRIREAAAFARANCPERTLGTLALLAAAFSLDPPFDRAPIRDRAIALAQAWQQFTGPLAAKGVEDTALYRDAALLALNDVGCEPSGTPGDGSLRAVLGQREAREHLALNATSTHDTKRGEDTRARIAALSHAPAAWTSAVDRWLARHEPHVEPLADGPAPTVADRFIIYQTLAALAEDDPGSLAAVEQRVVAYLTKAAREAKVRTSWVEPDTAYEEATARFIHTLVASPGERHFREELAGLTGPIRRRALQQTLGWILLKTLAPGVPDFYQGAEFLDLSLVDPDNRRPVDWASRQAALARLTGDWERAPAKAARLYLADSDLAKLFVTWRALAVRRWLLASDASLTIADWSAPSGPRSGYSWSARAGDRECRVTLGASPTEASGWIDQLAGPTTGSTAPRVLLRGVSTLVAPRP